MKNKIKDLLNRSGLIDVPSTPDEALTQYGLDSLTLVMFIVELENELGIKIDPSLARIENFETINKINELIESQGKK